MDEEKLEEAYRYWHDVGFDEGYDVGFEDGYADAVYEMEERDGRRGDPSHERGDGQAQGGA